MRRSLRTPAACNTRERGSCGRFDTALDPATLGGRLPAPPDLAPMPAPADRPRAVFAAAGAPGRRLKVEAPPTAALFRALFGPGSPDAHSCAGGGP